MRAGRLRHRVVLQKPVEVDDDYGEAVVSWQDQDTVWAAVEPVTAAWLASAPEHQVRATHRVVLRAYDGFAADWRVRFGARVLKVVSLRDPDERGEYLELLCEEDLT